MSDKPKNLDEWSAKIVKRTFTPEKCDALMKEFMFGNEPRSFAGLKEPTSTPNADGEK